MIAPSIVPLPSVDEMPRRGMSVSLGQAIAACVEAKRASGCRPAYVTSLRWYLTTFARGRENWPLAAVTVEVIEEWFDRRKETPSTRQSNAGRIQTLFSFAIRRKWVSENPCEFLEPIRVDRKPPFILKPLQCALILDWCRRRKPNQAAFFALAMLAGVRPQEIERLTWKAVNLDDGVVVIDAAASKVRTRRIVDLEPAALAWLRWAKERGGKLPVRRMTRRRYLHFASRLLGFESWPQDCLRHTAASYLLARHKNPGFVAFQLGNSAGILERHYKALVTDAEQREFWSFLPDSPRPEKPAPPPVEPPEVPTLPGNWGLLVDRAMTRFQRVEVALQMEKTIRGMARQRQRAGSYYGGVNLSRMPGERFDTIREIGKLAGCSRQTVQFCKHILAKADPDVVDKLRDGKLSIAGVYRRLMETA